MTRSQSQGLSMDEIRRAPEDDTEVEVTETQEHEIKKKWMILRIFMGAFYAFCGFLVMLTFMFHYKFWNTVAFGAIVGVIGTILMLVHIGWYRHYWHRQPNAVNTLTILMLTGCFGQLLGVCAMSVYITMAIMLHQDLNLQAGVDNYWMSTTWSFMTLKIAAGLFWYSRAYRRILKRAADKQPLARS